MGNRSPSIINFSTSTADYRRSIIIIDGSIIDRHGWELLVDGEIDSPNMVIVGPTAHISPRGVEQLFAPTELRAVRPRRRGAAVRQHEKRGHARQPRIASIVAQYILAA